MQISETILNSSTREVAKCAIILIFQHVEVSAMVKNYLAAENARLQKALSERNRKIRQLEEQVSLLQTQLADAEKLITSLQATSLGVLEDMDDIL